MDNSFSRIITLLRTERKLTQKQASAELGISQALLSHYERGIRECGLDFLCKAADYYGVSTDYLLGRTPDRSGAQLTALDLPEPEEADDILFGADDDPDAADSVERDRAQNGTQDAAQIRQSDSLAMSKKLVVSSVGVVFDLLRRVANKPISDAAAVYLELAVYKLFRLLYEADPKNPRSFFSVPTDMAQGATMAAMSMAEARLAALLRDKDAGAQARALTLSDTALQEDYPLYASALRGLIRDAESAAGEHITRV